MKVLLQRRQSGEEFQMPIGHAGGSVAVDVGELALGYIPCVVGGA